MLGFDIVSRATQPVLAYFTVIAVLDCFGLFIHGGLDRVEIALGKRCWLGNDRVDIVVTCLFGLTGDNLVNVALSATVDFFLVWNVTRVVRDVLLLVVERH